MDLHLFKFFFSFSMSASYIIDLLKLFHYLLTLFSVCCHFYLPSSCLLPSRMASILSSFV